MLVNTIYHHMIKNIYYFDFFHGYHFEKSYIEYVDIFKMINRYVYIPKSGF
jgi:hypothetical protein